MKHTHSTHTIERLEVQDTVLRYVTVAGFGSTPTSSASRSLMDNAECISKEEDAHEVEVNTTESKKVWSLS
jgi:hypothetical protein